MAKWFPGLRRLSEKQYSDVNPEKRDPERQRQPELDWFMERYDTWRSLFDGRALEETLSSVEDPGKAEDTYRWPVRFNLIKSYCLLYAGMLWGRAKTGAESDDLFDIRVDSKVPGRPGPEAKEQARKLQEALNYWWAYWFHVLRANATIQQWAGGCVLKVRWSPGPMSVYGTQLQTIQPEHFYPIWNPTNYEEMIACRIKFSVSKAVAMEVYGLTAEEIDSLRLSDNDKVPVEEHWDRYKYYIAIGKGLKDKDDPGIIARDRAGNRLQGDNPFRHPLYGVGVIPFVYVPRIRVGGFFGSSLAYDLEGLQNEVNKTLADFGDALTRGSHPPFGLSDYNGPGDKQGIIPIPKSGALNLGKTPAGREAPKVHTFPQPKVPPQTDGFTDRLLSLSEVSAGLTPAAKGMVQGAKSGFAMALEMLPTTNTIDWMRSHWTAAIAKPGGINDILMAIWHSKALEGLPTIEPGAVQLRQRVEYRPVVPRDRLEIIDEVTKLVTAKAVSPQEWLRRLGDIEDIDLELKQLGEWLVRYGELEAAVAGREIEIHEDTNPESVAGFMPEVAGVPQEPVMKQPAKQPEGQKPASKE